jgi:hypothetical protein
MTASAINRGGRTDRGREGRRSMKRTPFAVVMTIAAFLSGCVPSLHPLYTDADLAYDPALVGEWSSEGSSETWTFTGDSEKEYKLVYVDKDGAKGEFDVHLVKVKDRLFLDFFPKDPELQQNDFYKMHLLPVHTFMKVEQIEPTLIMSPLNPEWLGKYLEENPDAIAHDEVDDRLVLTAGTKELQAFLLEHVDDKDAWGESSDMRRKEQD